MQESRQEMLCCQRQRGRGVPLLNPKKTRRLLEADTLPTVSFSFSTSTPLFFSLNPTTTHRHSPFQIPGVAGSDPKLVVDGTWAPQVPSGAGALGRLATPPNVEAKVASLAASLNVSRLRDLPNVSGIFAERLAAKRNATKTDLGLQQNIRRAEGEVIDSLAGYAEALRTKGDAILAW